MKAKRLLLLTALWCALSCHSYSQTVIGRQLVDQYTSTWWGSTTYGLTWLPDDYATNPTQKYPLIIFLHGVGETGNGVSGLWSLLNAGLPRVISQGWDPEAVNPVDGQTYKFIVVSPQGTTSMAWAHQWNTIQYILPDVISRYRIDTTRIYITGLSAGGNGTWTCLTSGPEAATKFAAAVPVASAPIPLDSIPQLGSLYGVKLWQACGSNDAFYNFSTSSTLAYNSGSPTPNPQATLTTFTGQGHSGTVWNTVYSPAWTSNVHGMNIYEWMLQYQRTTQAAELIADAGTDQTITLPVNTVTLTGTATLPAGDTVTSYSWTKIAGPAGDLIVSPNSASTQVTNLVEGVYTFEFEVISSSDTASATVQVTVLPANIPPVASAGSDQTIQLPINTAQLSGSGSDVDGNITSYAWTQVSGPSTATIVSPSQDQTQVTGLIQGVYEFELTVTDDDGATGLDTVQVTVLAAANVPPVADAGTDITIQLPIDYTTLMGSGSDADGNIASYSWNQISGPSTATVVSPNQDQTQVTNLIQGAYEFELTVTDNDGASDTDTVIVTVAAAANVPPTAFAGNDIIITLPEDSVMLNGSGADSDGTVNSYLWTQISGPAPSNIADDSQAQTMVYDLVEGTYLFELKVTDNDGAETTDTVQVVVNPATPTNQIPQALAGSDIIITLPEDSVQLQGSGIDADGTIVTYLWTQIDGPSTATIIEPDSATTMVNGLEEGIYFFELQVTDNDGATAVDTVMVTVNPAVPTNQIPQALAGSDIIITLPEDSAQLQGSGIDADGTIVTYLWTQIDGPSTATIVEPDSATTMVNDLEEGIYFFELQVTDNDGATAVDTVMVTVNPAPPANQIPEALAGSDVTITLPVDSIELQGAGIDNDGTIVSYQWTQVGGPSGATIAEPDSATTMVNGLVAGTYLFELQVTDNEGATAVDTVTVTVNPQPTTNCNGVKHYLVPGGDDGLFMTADTSSYWYRQVNPGDTLVLSSQDSWTYLRMEEYKGTAACPIVVMNEGGQVWMKDGIYAKNAHYMKITGSGAPNVYYGIKVYSPEFDGYSVAINIQGRSKNIEVERIDVKHKGYGVWAKQDPLCDPAYNYPNYVMDSIEIHHCRFKRIWQDCIYAGNTDPLGERVTMCNGVATHPIPMRMSNVHLHHLIIDSCGRTGIQLTGADAGINSIHDNIVTNCGYEYNQWQGTGISIGGMTKNCYVYNNVVKNSFIYGIFDLGADSSFVYNNYIDSSGFLKIDPAVNIDSLAAATNTTALPGRILKNTMSMPGNIQTTTRESIPHSTKTVFYRNNRVGKNASTLAPNGLIAFGWWGPAEDWTTYNQVCGNTLLDGVTPAKVDLFWYTDSNQYWPVIDTSCTLAANMPPAADAGEDTTLATGATSVMLQGSGTDHDGVIVAYEWQLISGPSQYTIADPTSAQTLVSNMVPGVYTFRLKVTDNMGDTATDDVQIFVDPPNHPPIANAGPYKVITLPVTVTVLQGGAVDPDGDDMTFVWTKISGPSQYTLVDFNKPYTNLNNLTAGVYWFELTVTDAHGAVDKDSVRVDVNIAPVANAGNDITITLPNNSVTLSGSGTDVDGTIFSYTWSQAGGPAQYTIVSPGQAQTDIQNLTAGVYKFELVVRDNFNAPGRDTVTVTVLPALNSPPVADAGSDITIQLPVNNVTLSGAGIDNGGTIVSYEWNKVSGPASYLINSPMQAQTTVVGLVAGVYEFELTVTDNDGASGKDTVRVTVLPANVPPVVNAGTNITIQLPVNYTALNGSATDIDGNVVSYTWTKISGPAQFNIANPAQGQTSLTNLVLGVYEFQLEAVDNDGASGFDTVTVTVNAAPNQLPVADAGPDQDVTLPANTASLLGSGSDNDGVIVNYHWDYVSGPAGSVINNASSAQTTVGNLSQGVYVFSLTVTDDDGASDVDYVTVTVHPPANIPPIAAAGTDITIQLPIDYTTLMGSGSDADGNIASYAWNQVSGPSTATVVSPSQNQTQVTGLVQGVYEFELTVTDDDGASDTDTVMVTVLAAANIPPVADAGTDITIQLPIDYTTLMGSGSDADGTITSYAWNQVSGPSTATIVSPSQDQSQVTGLVQGVYEFELTVTDNDGDTDTDTVIVTVLAAPPVNSAPTADAGTDIVITLPEDSVMLIGSGVDTDGTIVSYMWTKVSGPASFIIESATQSQTKVRGLVEGVYEFELTVTDNEGATSVDTVMVTVNPEPPNVPPTAFAGYDQTITFPANTVMLTGSGTDVDGTIVSYQWTKISGPPAFNILTPNGAQTFVTGLLANSVYEFELTVTDDDGAVGKDTVAITVNEAAANVPPVANAGPDTTILLPINSVTLTGSGTDVDGTIVGYQWVKISGPIEYTITTPNQKTTEFRDLVEGEYEFELRVVDNWGAIGKDTVKVTVANTGRVVTSTTVYPNPAHSEITVRIVSETQMSKTLLNIYDMKGALVYSEEFVRTDKVVEKKINVSNLVPGVYVIDVKVDINTRMGIRFIKE